MPDEREAFVCGEWENEGQRREESRRRGGEGGEREVCLLHMSMHGKCVLNTDNCRHDFYQTPTTVIVSFFLKKIDKTKASIEFSSPHELSLDLPTSDTPPKRYKAIVPLFGPIDTKVSTSSIMGTKLEVTLVKTDGSSWPVLRSDEQRTGEIIQVGKAGRA